MMTMEQVKAEQKRLARIEMGLNKLQRIKNMNRMLESENFALTLSDAISTLMGNDQMISFVLNDQEQAVLAKGIQVTLEFARQRIEKEINEA